ncbi:MAG: hypothetical protein SPJ55_01600 [Treponema sp.]|nr:hypothetical protein [Treponema sp.]
MNQPAWNIAAYFACIILSGFLFLASDLVSYITGDVLHIDGAARA